jgi:hypothetical protein
MKTKNKDNNNQEEKPAAAEEEISLDTIARDFLFKHRIRTSESGIYVWDETCYRQQSRKYLDWLVFGETPEAFRSAQWRYLINNIITRSYVESERLLSAYCIDDGGDILVNCQNGILRWHRDPATLTWQLEKLEPHDHTRLFTGALAANYDPKAECPITDRALEAIQPDPEDRELLWLFGAYILIPDCRLEQCMFWKGGGGMGMGTAIKIYTAPLGEKLVMAQDMKVLNDDKRYGLSLLKFALLSVCSELSDKEINDSAIWKKLVVGEHEMQRNPYAQFGKMKTACKHVIQGNNLPNIKKATEADLRRISAIAFVRQFEGENRDTELKPTIEAERDGHLARIVERVPALLGLRGLPAGGGSSKRMEARMRVVMFPTGAFVKHCAVVAPLKRDGKKLVGLSRFKEDIFWAWDEFMMQTEMSQMVGNQNWLRDLYDHYGVLERRGPQEFKRKRVLWGIDLNPKWREKRTKATKSLNINTTRLFRRA